MTDIWQHGDVTLYLGDCLDILPTLAAGSVDAVITDPPYGTGKLETNGGSYKVKPTRAIFDWDIWNSHWIDLIDSKCKAIFVPPSELSKMLDGNRLLCAITKQGVCVKNVSPVYRTQPIVLIGKTPVNYKRDWCEYKNTGKHENHPTEKPLEIMTWLIELTSDSGATILDPFMGSGTTGVACVQLGRKFIGIEIEPKYFEIAKRRIAEAQMQIRMNI